MIGTIACEMGTIACERKRCISKIEPISLKLHEIGAVQGRREDGGKQGTYLCVSEVESEAGGGIGVWQRQRMRSELLRSASELRDAERSKQSSATGFCRSD